MTDSSAAAMQIDASASSIVPIPASAPVPSSASDSDKPPKSKGKGRGKKPKDENKIRKPSSNETKTYEAEKQTQALILSMYGGTLDPMVIKFEELDVKPFLSFYNEGKSKDNDGLNPCPYLEWTTGFNTLPKCFLEGDHAKFLPRIMFAACRNAYQVFKLSMAKYEQKMAAFNKFKQEREEAKALEKQRKRKERDADKDSTKPKKQKKASDVAAALAAGDDNSPIAGVPLA